MFFMALFGHLVYKPRTFWQICESSASGSLTGPKLHKNGPEWKGAMKIFGPTLAKMIIANTV